MPSKLSLVLQLSTSPVDPTKAVTRTAGWSEGMWFDADIASSAPFIPALASARARLMPAAGSVVGFRIGYYTISGNKLLPRGTAAGKLLRVGRLNVGQDDPRLALEVTMPGVGQPNSSTFTLRGLPDDIVQGGEFQGSQVFTTFLTQYTNLMNANAAGFIGRDLSVGSARVLTIAGGVVTLDAALAGGAVNGFLRLRRVTDDNEKPVIGTFRITAIAGAAYTVSGLAGITVSNANGTARIDGMRFITYGAYEIGAIRTKKVGRPSKQYRGRASKRR